MNALRASLARIGAIMIKELIQMKRDRLTFAMILLIPLVELVLFGYAINMDPKHLPTAVHLEEQTPIVRSLLKGMENSRYFDFVEHSDDPRVSQSLLARGEVSFVVSIPAGFTEQLLRGEHPALLVEADATDPVAAAGALSHLPGIIQRVLQHELKSLPGFSAKASPVDLTIHRYYNPEGITQYNIVPGLLGVILTMTMVMITSMAMTRETERGTMENLLSMPSKPLEVMIGKITPYIGVGAIQTLVILVTAHFLFSVPFVGSMALLIAGLALFILANLALGFTFSTLAKSQMQAMQLTFFFFLPSILLSGFMFPFRGMPVWAQWLGEVLPLTHFLRIVRGVMLKDSSFMELGIDFLALLGFLLAIGLIAIGRYRDTLD